MPRPVVAAAIVDSLTEPTKLLACSRAYPQELRGQFELPGGKVEDNEDPVEALTREIAEELGTRLTIGDPGWARHGRVARRGGGRLARTARGRVAPRGQVGALRGSHGASVDRR